MSVTPIRKSISEAANRSHRDLLVALRDVVAEQIDNDPPAHVLDRLVRILRDISLEIQELDAVSESDDVGDAAETPDEPWSG